MNTYNAARDPTAYLLDGMYKNVKMESESIVSILPKVQDRFLIKELTSELMGYSSYAKSIEEIMRGRGMEPEPPGFLSKMGAKAGITINTAIDSTVPRIAEICIGRAKNSARRLERMCSEVEEECDAHVMCVCKDLIEKERIGVEKMEAFL